MTQGTLLLIAQRKNNFCNQEEMEIEILDEDKVNSIAIMQQEEDEISFMPISDTQEAVIVSSNMKMDFVLECSDHLIFGDITYEQEKISSTLLR